MANDGSVRIGAEIDESGFKSSLSKLSSSAKGALGAVGKAAGVALGAATAATTAFAKSAVDAGMNFDSAMSQVAATMGKTTEEITDLRAAALDAGSTTAFSATEAAEALNYLALAGYDAGTAADTLPAVLNLAAAGGMDLAYASDLATDAMSALGIEAGNANLTEFGDKMAVTASKANASVAELGEAILQVGATAQMLSGGTTELNAALGILADNGTKGAEGGTRLRNIILSLMAPTDTAAAAMEGLGVSAIDAATGGMKPLEDILAELNIAMAGFSDERRIKTINTIFNKTDIGDVNYLLGVSRERWAELGSAIDSSEGAMQKMADTQLDNLAGDITKFKSALEGAQIVLSDEMTPTLREFVQFGTKAIGTLSQAFQEGGLNGAMEALGTILSDGIAMVMEMLPVMIEAGMGLLSALGQGILDNLPIIMDAALDVAFMLAEGIYSAITQVAPTLRDAALEMMSNLGSYLKESLPSLIESGLSLLSDFSASLRENAGILVDAALELAKNLAQGLADSLPTIIEQVPEIVSNIAGIINDNAPKILFAGAQIIGTLLLGMIKAIPTLIMNLPQILVAIVDVISAFNWVNLGKSIVSGLVNGIKGMAGDVKLVAETILQNISTVLSDLPEYLKAIGADMLKSLWNGIMSMGDWFKSQLKNFISNAISGMLDGVKNLFGIGDKSSASAVSTPAKSGGQRKSSPAALSDDESGGLSAYAVTRARDIAALESAIPAAQSRVAIATASMAPAAGYSAPPTASGGGNTGGQQAPMILRPNWTMRFEGDLAQVGQVLKPVIDTEDARVGVGVQ